MYCPLCKAEYRDGFTECSDCHIALVPTQEQANQFTTGQLCTDDGAVLNALLNSLADENIAFRSREVLRSSPWPWLSFLFWRYAKPKPASEFRVDVFEKDWPRAKEIFDRVAAAEPLD